MDYRVFQAVNGLAGHVAWVDRAFVVIAVYGPLVFIAALAWLWVASRGPSPRSLNRLAVGRALAAAALALTVGQGIILVHPRPRPFVTHQVRLLIAPTADPSFPSDHALAAFAIAGAVAGIDLALGSGLALVAAALAFARVFVGTHYPGDVLGGAAIGGALAATIRWADPWLRPVVELGSRWTDALAARLHADPPAITPRR